MIIFLYATIFTCIIIAINANIECGEIMKTIQMTLDDDLVAAVDKISKALSTNRSAFTRKALRDAINNYKREQLELKHKEGYLRYPVTPDEFINWEDEQAWSDE